MGDFDSYKKRLSISGNSDSNAIFNSTQQAIVDLFDKSPYYSNILIGSQNVDVRILNGETDSKRTLTLKPNTVVNFGDYTTFYDRTWMVTSVYTHPLYPKLEVDWCTSVLKWKDKNGNVLSYSCTFRAATKRVSESNGQYFLESNIPMYLLVQINSDTIQIQKGLRFISNGQAFQVAGIDSNTYNYSGHGMYMFGVEYQTLTDGDDLVNSIADNTLYYRAFGNEQGTGGVIKW